MSRAFNFSAGPAILPESVLQQAQQELLEWGDCRASVMEISHRDKAFVDVAARAEANLRQLMGIPESYKVLFLQGGATQQFALIPMNLCAPEQQVDFLLTGHWGEKALKEAGKVVNTRVCGSDAERGYRGLPAAEIDPQAAFLHVTPNETIHGVEMHSLPDSPVPIVADMSSTILSRPLDVSQYGVIYAGAQKNIGPSGLTVLIVDEALLGERKRSLPDIFDYRKHAAADSMLNTPPTFAWYLAGLVFEWLQAQGGLQAMGERNARKAQMLYDAIDGSDFYRNPVDPNARSWMNVPFTLADDALDKPFLAGAVERGLLGLKGHRAVGGMRASIYNAMPEAGVQALVDYMHEFAASHG
ncbi:MAG: 3-phosphoserine/phosphohydroxythreonine transaminase [Lysobacterales bacterium]